ncbi:MAG: ribosomal protein [Micavibrio sp.]|nr:ribosomal protein [Micavibrio sp.]
MPTNASAKKRVKRNEHRATINGARRNSIRTFIKKVEAALLAGDANAATEALKVVQPELARGVSKGIVEKNAASRKMSRLSARIKTLKKA